MEEKKYLLNDKKYDFFHRYKGCELIQESGILLRLPQVCMVTAQVIYHNFYRTNKFSEYDPFHIAMGCILLSCKIEEKARRLKDIINIFILLYYKKKYYKNDKLTLEKKIITYTLLPPSLLLIDQVINYQYTELLINTEKIILFSIGFNIYSLRDNNLPHKYLLYFIHALQGSKELAQKSWNYLNDSLRIDLLNYYKSQEIVCASIYLASRNLQIIFPNNTKKPWFTIFGINNIEILQDIGLIIMKMYDKIYKENKNSFSLFDEKQLETRQSKYYFTLDEHYQKVKIDEKKRVKEKEKENNKEKEKLKYEERHEDKKNQKEKHPEKVRGKEKEKEKETEKQTKKEKEKKIENIREREKFKDKDFEDKDKEKCKYKHNYKLYDKDKHSDKDEDKDKDKDKDKYSNKYNEKYNEKYNVKYNDKYSTKYSTKYKDKFSDRDKDKGKDNYKRKISTSVNDKLKDIDENRKKKSKRKT